MIKFCCNFINSTKNKPSSLGWWLILTIPALRNSEAENWEFKSSLPYKG